MNSDLIAVRTFSFRPEAERAQQVLEASGITSVLRGDDASGWAPHIGFGTGGVTLFVHHDNFEQSQKILEEAHPR